MKSINPLVAGALQPLVPVKKGKTERLLSSSFGETFKKTSAAPSALTISKHAKQRLMDRGIHLSTDQWNTIAEKLAEARSKGITDSLVILKNAALVTSVKNNTVITAMNREEAAAQIFTNINGAILMDHL